MADTPGTGSGRFDFSRTGTLVYFSNKDAEALALASWISSAGKVDPVINTPTQAETPRLSPDGKRLALTVAGDLLVYDLQRGTLTKLTFDAALNRRPVWTPDGKHIVFASDTASPAGEYGMWWIRADGSSQPEKLIAEKTPLQPWSISPDGRRVAFVRTASDRNFEIWTLALDFTDSDHPKPRELQPFLREPAGQVDPTFSPDGKWIAYASTTPGAPKVVVRPFPSTSSAPRWQISEGNGRFPLWSRNGRELFYLDNNDHIVVVRYSVIEDSFIAEKPTQWSPVSIFRSTNLSLWNLDLTPDGKRFIALAKPATSAENVHATVLLNFFDELRRRSLEK
jgi:Tol biopolymer transport system component